MTKSKSELILNPDYYSADGYILEDREEQNPMDSLIKLLGTFLVMGVVIIGIFIFIYTSYVKNNLSSISTWLSEAKQTILFENEKVIKVKKEEIKIDKVKEVQEKKQIDTLKEIKVKSNNSKVLSDEYIKLIQKNLGNY